VAEPRQVVKAILETPTGTDIDLPAEFDELASEATLSTRATEATLAKLMPTTATKYAVALTNADTEYSQALPANTKKFRIHLRDFATFRLAYETGKVAGSVDPYETIPAGSEKYEDGILVTSLTVYLASPVAGKTAEVEASS
jgi:hypothetical protein